VHANFGQCQTIIEKFVIEHKFVLEMWNTFMNSYLYFQMKKHCTGEHVYWQRISIHAAMIACRVHVSTDFMLFNVKEVNEFVHKNVYEFVQKSAHNR
jgi:hypothetical protein